MKVLDFGLAKALAGDAADVDLSMSPTLSMAATQQGVILGTAAYMSPEQARGVPVDKRADIWAFGCIFYEMLSGRQVFRGELVTDVMAAVLKSDPDYKGLPPNIHPEIRELIRRCLEREPKKRWHDVGDVRVEIEQVLSDPTGAMVETVAAQTPRRALAPWVLATFIVATIIASVTTWYVKPAPIGSVTRFSVPLPENQTFRGLTRRAVAVSPDGSLIAYAGGDIDATPAESLIYLRRAHEFGSTPIAGTEGGGRLPFFSPDGKWLAFWSQSEAKLKKVPIGGGVPVSLCDATNPAGASWGPDGNILFGQRDGIWSVSSNSGEGKLVIPADPGEAMSSPQLLPDGKSILFSLTASTGLTRWDEGRVMLHSMESGERVEILAGASEARYVPTGHLVYALGNVLFAAPFHLGKLELGDERIGILEDVKRGPNPAVNPSTSHYSFSDTGSLVYIESFGLAPPTGRSVWIVGRDNERRFLDIPPAQYTRLRVSPDGSTLAVQTTEEDGIAIYIYDLSGDNTIQRLTFGGNNGDPLWTPDGTHITFTSDRDRTGSISGSLYRQPADGSGPAERLTTADEGVAHRATSWNSVSRTLAFNVAAPAAAAAGIWMLPANGTTPEALVDEPEALEFNAAFSPDGKWFAYQSDEGDGPRVYVEPFPRTGAKYQIGTGRGAYPRWSRDGSKLFYLNRRRFSGVDIQTDPVFTQSIPREGRNILPGTSYDLLPDGSLVGIGLLRDETGSDEPAPQRINVVLNWFVNDHRKVNKSEPAPRF